mgnify:FL=1|tara:strand:+ start:3042 stop:3227 length:186 start_codon:yes stop_codon:yes gene_type:complete
MNELIIAIGLLLILEGLLYAIFPSQMKNMLNQIKDFPISKLRSGGLVFAILGFIIVWFLKQ